MKPCVNIVMSFVFAALVAAHSAAAGQIEDAHAAYDSGDYTTAVKLWRSLAEQGNAEAQEKLGEMYFLGKGLPSEVTADIALRMKEARRLYKMQTRRTSSRKAAIC